MKKSFSTYVFTWILCTGLIASGCGAGGIKNSASEATVSESVSNQSEKNYDAELSMEVSSDSSMDSGADASASLYDSENDKVTSAAGTDSSATDMAVDQNNTENGIGENLSKNASTAQNTKEKLIYTYHYSVETKKFEDFLKKISQKTKQLDGYIESSETNGSSWDRTNRSANLILRIPADQMQQMLTLIDTESNVTYNSSGVENITLQYIDLQSHIKALRTEQETLLELIEKADKLKDIIALQSQLTQVRYEIESYESRLRTYDNLVNYSTLNLSVQEVERTTTVTPVKAGFGEEVKNKFSDNLYAVGQWLRSMAIWLIGSLPILIPAVIAAVIMIMLIRKWRKRIRRPASNSSILHGYQSIYQCRQEKGHTDNQNTDSQTIDSQNADSRNTDISEASETSTEHAGPLPQEVKQKDSNS